MSDRASLIRAHPNAEGHERDVTWVYEGGKEGEKEGGEREREKERLWVEPMRIVGTVKTDELLIGLSIEVLTLIYNETIIPG